MAGTVQNPWPVTRVARFPNYSGLRGDGIAPCSMHKEVTHIRINKATISTSTENGSKNFQIVDC